MTSPFATIITMLLVIVAAPALAAADTDAYTGTYTNPDWEGGAMTISIAKTAVDGKHPAKIACIWDGSYYEYEGSFQPITADGTLTGTVDSEDGMGDPATYIVKGKVDGKTFKALYWLEGEDEPKSADDAHGTMTLVLGATPPVTEDME